jgi:tetratricopeptide (TPR) repeat protein
MRTRFSAALLAGALVAVTLPLGGCNQVAHLKGNMAFKDANAFYQSGDYRKAAEKYEETLQHDPTKTAVYFYLGNSYENLYKPAREGEPENDAYLEKAIANYRRAAEEAEDPKIKKLAMQYLVAAYRDKLNDPAQAEPIVQQMIQMDPDDPENYFALAKIYEDSGNYEQAEQVLLEARDARPNDPVVYMQLAGFYNRQGQFDKTIESLQARADKEPNNPEAYYTIATFLWDKAYRDFRLKDAQKREYIDQGIQASQRAIDIRPDYMEALVYKGLLLRLAANMEKDRGRQQALLKEADDLRDKANTIRKQKQAGAGAGTAGN